MSAEAPPPPLPIPPPGPIPSEDAHVAMPGSVLFVCNHNIIRSPMAEALARLHFGDRIYVASAGVRTGQPDPFVGAVMGEKGLDLVGREPQAMEELEDSFFDLIITLSPTAHHVALAMEIIDTDAVEYWPAADPTVVTGAREQRLDAYRDVRDRLEARILERFGPS